MKRQTTKTFADLKGRRIRTASMVIAGVFGVSALMGLTACQEPETPDVEAPAFDSAAATLSLTGGIDKSSEANRISADLFGLFLEDINYASFALDDNLIINGSFENSQTALTGGKLHGWSAAGGTSISADTDNAVLKGNNDFVDYEGNLSNPTSARIVAQAEGSVTAKGHDATPIAVEEGVDYVFSAFIKPDTYEGEIAIEVTNGTDVYAAGSIDVSGTEWVKYQTTITASESASSGLSLRLTFAEGGTLYLDNVKLETTDSTVGIKNYIYEAIADLSPKFFRFPGGCIIEGTDDESAYDWKNSIGAVATTDDPTSDKVPAFTYTVNEDGSTREVTTYGEQATRTWNTDLWAGSNNYYQMEYGLGFYEYFVLCDQLGAKAIPIVNCGYSCMVRGGKELSGRHGNRIDDYIQDALDLVAFAKGDPDSADANEAYWAQVRVDMGHPEPFEMDYIGIGNEQWGVYYTSYYEKFLEAFAEAKEENPLYDTVKPIVGNCTMFEHCENEPNGITYGAAQSAARDYRNRNKIGIVSEYGVHDQHYYVNYTDFFTNTYMYDSYARPDTDFEEYYEVFVGEYAANSQSTTSPRANANRIFSNVNSSWLNALSEAAMMTGYERNGDIVKLAAYAPMFGNLLAGRQWQVDMMYFNSTQLIKTPSYYVQQMFMKHSGDYKVASDLEFAAGEMPTVTFKGNGSLTCEADSIYYVVSADEETGDIIIKIVNASEEPIDFNISLAGLDVDLSGLADVYELVGYDYDDVNELDNEYVTPFEPYTIGAFTNGNTFGYTVQAMSVNAIRVRVK